MIAQGAAVFDPNYYSLMKDMNLSRLLWKYLLCCPVICPTKTSSSTLSSFCSFLFNVTFSFIGAIFTEQLDADAFTEQ